MKTVTSLAGTDRQYLKVDGAPIRLSKEEDGGETKVHIEKGKGIRIEDNRIVFYLKSSQKRDLINILKTIG